MRVSKGMNKDNNELKFATLDKFFSIKAKNNKLVFNVSEREF